MHPTPAKSSTSNLSAWLQPHPRLDGLAVIDHLYNRMDGMYPHRWRSAFGSPQAVANWREAWAEGFAEEGITLDEIKAGLTACRRLFDWPPSQAEFLRACRPPIDPEAAFHEAVKQVGMRQNGKDKWQHPAIFWTAHKIGDFEMQRATWQGIKARWSALLAEQLALREWPAIPPRLDALPAPGRTVVTQEEGRKRVGECFIALGQVNRANPATVARDGE